MTIPAENITAFFPPSRTVGKVTMQPLTLAGAVRLAQSGVDLSHRIPSDKLIASAVILSGLPLKDFCKRYKGGLTELSDAVESVLNEAFATFIRPREEESKGAVKHLTPHGLGWPLECAEFLCAEYGWSWREAIETPVATVFALIAAFRQRNGGKHGGLDYIERQYCADLKAGKVKPITIDNGKEKEA